MTYKEFVRIVGGDDALNAIYATFYRAGKFELSRLIMSDDEARELYEDIYIDETKTKFSDWGELRDEISNGIRACGNNPVQLKRYVCSLMTPLDDVADYFDFDLSLDKNSRLAGLLLNKVAGMQLPSIKEIESWQEEAEMKADEYEENIRHQRYLECDDEDAEEDDDRFGLTTDEYEEVYEKYHKAAIKRYEDEWKRPEYILLSKVRFGLRNLAYIIEGALLENGCQSNLFDYEKECGVVLVRKVELYDLVNAMGWTATLAKTYLPETIYYKTPRKNYTDFPELKQAKEDGQIDERGHLLVSNLAFIRYCKEHGFFGLRHLDDWRPIDGVLTSKKGVTISADMLKQASQDVDKQEVF